MPEPVVAFQGEPGAFSEQALRMACGDRAQPRACHQLADVFAAVVRGDASLAVVPVENSWAGSIHQTYDLLLEHPLQIRGEVAVPVEHCLLAAPGTGLPAVRRVYSHPQALAQCEAYIRSLHAEAVAVYDTAGSARLVAERAEVGAAAIASARAAGLYGLEILGRGVQDARDNITRFYVVGPPGPPVPGGDGPPRTVVALALPDDTPGALYWSLGILAYWRVNLTKIESRPSRRRPWHYVFHLEMDAAAEAAPCRSALDELRARSAQVRVLGSFPRGGAAGAPA